MIYSVQSVYKFYINETINTLNKKVTQTSRATFSSKIMYALYCYYTISNKIK